MRGMPSAYICVNARKQNQARATPATAPIRANTTLSVSNCLMMRPGVAPNARRSAISGERLAARLINRFATLAQAMRRTNATAICAIHKRLLMFPIRNSLRGVIIVFKPLSGGGGLLFKIILGFSAAARLIMAVVSARAADGERPYLSFPTDAIVKGKKAWGSSPIGVHTCVSGVGNKKLAGITPRSEEH